MNMYHDGMRVLGINPIQIGVLCQTCYCEFVSKKFLLPCEKYCAECIKKPKE